MLPLLCGCPPLVLTPVRRAPALFQGLTAVLRQCSWHAASALRLAAARADSRLPRPRSLRALRLCCANAVGLLPLPAAGCCSRPHPCAAFSFVFISGPCGCSAPMQSACCPAVQLPAAHAHTRAPCSHSLRALRRSCTSRVGKPPLRRSGPSRTPTPVRRTLPSGLTALLHRCSRQAASAPRLSAAAAHLRTQRPRSLRTVRLFYASTVGMLPLLYGPQSRALTPVCRALVLSGPHSCTAPMQLACCLCSAAVRHSPSLPCATLLFSSGLTAVTCHGSLPAASAPRLSAARAHTRAPRVPSFPGLTAVLRPRTWRAASAVRLSAARAHSCAPRSRPLGPRGLATVYANAIGMLPLPCGCPPPVLTTVCRALVIPGPRGLLTPMQLV